MSTPGPVLKHWLGFSYIHSKYYMLDLSFDETEMKIKSDHSSENKVKSCFKNIVVIEEEQFSDMNSNDGATFITALIKRAKNRFNK